MSDESRDLVTAGGVELPAFMTQDVGTGLEDVDQSNEASRIKIVQKMASDELLEKFKPGDLILSPEQELLCPAGGKVAFTPIFYWTDFCLWEPVKSNAENPIVERSTDRKSEIARRCQNKEDWFEYHPDHPEGTEDAEDWRRRYVQHLCYIIVPEHEEFNEPVVLSFQKGDYRRGLRWGTKLVRANAPIFGQRWLLSTSTRETSNPYKGYDLELDTDNRFVDARIYENYKAMHEQFKSIHEQGNLAPGDNGKDTDAETTVEPSDTL